MRFTARNYLTDLRDVAIAYSVAGFALGLGLWCFWALLNFIGGLS